MAAIDIQRATAEELTRAYRIGTLSPVDVTEVMLAGARIAGERYDAVAALVTDQAIADARSSEARYAENEQLGPLDGVPVSVKDSINVTGIKRWHGSRAHDDKPAATFDGAPVKRLREAGAVVFAKTTMAEFGLMSSGQSTQFGQVSNPWDPRVSTGGSSAGAGALVAAGIGPMAIGTDMAGSVRLPANQCGLVAIKATQGRIAYDPPKLMGVPGPMTRTVRDCTTLLSVIGAPDASDHLSLPGRFEPADAPLSDLNGLEIGLLEWVGYGPRVDPRVAAVVEDQARVLERAGARIVRIPGPVLDESALEDLLVIYNLKAIMEIEALAPERRALVHPKIHTLVEPHRGMSAVDYLAAEHRLGRARATFAAVIDAYDYVLSAVMPVLSFPVDRYGPDESRSTLDHLSFTNWHNVSSQPAGTVPVAMVDGLPVGVQVASRRFNDAGVLQLLELLERERAVDLDYPYLVVPRG